MSMIRLAAHDAMEMEQIKAITRQEQPFVASENFVGMGLFC